MNERTEGFLNRLGFGASQLLALERLPERSRELCILVSGSLVEGLGNSTSDIDLYVIGDASPKGRHVIQKKNAFCISKHQCGGRRVDVEFWSKAGATELADKLSRIVVDRDLDAFECEAVDFMHRLKVGLPLGDEAAFEEWKAHFDFAKLLKYQQCRARINLQDMLEDVEGMLVQLDFEAALIRSRDLLDEIVIFTLRCLGESNPKMKWRIRLLQKYIDSEQARLVLNEFWTLQYPDVQRLRSDEQALRGHIDSCIRLAHQIFDGRRSVPAQSTSVPRA